jgi:hypothetical protein
MDPVTLDQVRLNFNPTGIAIINAAIGFMMLGVALELRLEDFKRIATSPKAPVIGLVAQFLLLPAFTFLLVFIIKPYPSIALGLVLVFNFFNGLGGMAIVVAWWGIWHIIAGLVTAFIFSRKKLPENEVVHE